MATQRKLLRLSDAAKYLHLGRSQLNQLALDGKVARIPVGNGQYRYSVGDLEAYLTVQQARYIPDYLQKQIRDHPHRIDPLWLSLDGDRLVPPHNSGWIEFRPHLPRMTDEHRSDASST
jgi:hypothetical protein